MPDSALRAIHPCLTLFIALFLIGCTDQSSSTDTSNAGLASLVDSAITSLGVSGAVLSIEKNGIIVHQSSHGFAHRYGYGGVALESPIPMQSDHVFDLASLTKVFATTYGIMLLVEDGSVSLNEPVKTYLPAFSSPSKDSVTVRHLLTHTSGLHPWKPVYYHANNADEALTYIAELPLATAVGSTRRYSDLGFMLLGYVVKAVSGQSLDLFLTHRLYAPLKLTHTGFNLQNLESANFAATSHGNPFEKRMVADDRFGYVCDEDPEAFTAWRTRVLVGEVNDGNAYHAHDGLAGHAGLFSTAADLHKLLNLLFEGGSMDGQHYISQSIINTFLTPDGSGNGLGWAMSPDVLMAEFLPEDSFGHTGFTGTYALAIPAHGLSILLLTNRQHAGVGPDGRYPALNSLRRSVVKMALDLYPAKQ